MKKIGIIFFMVFLLLSGSVIHSTSSVDTIRGEWGDFEQDCWGGAKDCYVDDLPPVIIENKK